MATPEAKRRFRGGLGRGALGDGGLVVAAVEGLEVEVAKWWWQRWWQRRWRCGSNAVASLEDLEVAAPNLHLAGDSAPTIVSVVIAAAISNHPLLSSHLRCLLLSIQQRRRWSRRLA
uniref:Uncharacterized protein n=1 Tax=Oryza rufipogon TaxID=4529 RepID=A0A2I4S666_ORYRU|nr:hypothetical protein DX_1 [Oryza rufipogon]